MVRIVAATAVAFLVLSLSPAAHATTIHVPDEAPTIAAGIAAAANGDTVLVNAGTYVENIDFAALDITVASHYLVTADSTFIDNTVIQSQSPGTPVVTIAGGQTRDARLCGFTVTGGLPTDGCGIHISAADPTIDHNRIWQNRARYQGGGIRIEGGAPAVRHNRIEGNVTDNHISQHGGAGIFVFYGAPELEYNRIIGNIAGTSGLSWGGGICAMLSSPTIRSNVIGLNEASERGGGIACGECDPIIVDNEIYSNTAIDYCGGGIASRNGAPIIEGNLIYGNDGARFGGGLFY